MAVKTGRQSSANSRPTLSVRCQRCSYAQRRNRSIDPCHFQRSCMTLKCWTPKAQFFRRYICTMLVPFDQQPSQTVRHANPCAGGACFVDQLLAFQFAIRIDSLIHFNESIQIDSFCKKIGLSIH